MKHRRRKTRKNNFRMCLEMTLSQWWDFKGIWGTSTLPSWRSMKTTSQRRTISVCLILWDFFQLEDAASKTLLRWQSRLELDQHFSWCPPRPLPGSSCSLPSWTSQSSCTSPKATPVKPQWSIACSANSHWEMLAKLASPALKLTMPNHFTVPPRPSQTAPQLHPGLLEPPKSILLTDICNCSVLWVYWDQLNNSAFHSQTQKHALKFKESLTCHPKTSSPQSAILKSQLCLLLIKLLSQWAVNLQPA